MNATTNSSPLVANAATDLIESTPKAVSVMEREILFGPIVFWLVSRITPSANQPRKTFDEAELRQMAATMVKLGVLEPILCVPGEPGWLEIVAGERRWRASGIANLKEVPVRVANRSLPPEEVLELQMVENTTAQSIPPLELAEGLHQLKTLRPRPLSELAEAVGLHASTVSRLLTLLKQPEPIKTMIRNETLSPAVAIEIAKLKAGAGDKVALAEQAASNGLSRDKVAALVARGNAGQKPPKPAKGKPVSRLVLHVEQPAVDVTLSAVDGKPFTLETVITALDTIFHPARRLQKGAGDLADLTRRFSKKNHPAQTTVAPGQNGKLSPDSPSMSPKLTQQSNEESADD